MIRRVTPKTGRGDRISSSSRNRASALAKRHQNSQKPALLGSLKRWVWAIISKRILTLILLTLFGSSIGLASTRVGTTKPLILQSSEVMLSPLPPLADETTLLLPTQLLPQSSQVTQQNTQVSLGKALLSQLPPVATETTAPTAPRRAEFLSQVLPQVIRQGTQVSLNGRRFAIAWRQWQMGRSVRTGISDVGLTRTMGMELLSTNDLTQQPVQWFSDPQSTPLVLASQRDSAYRYLDVSDFAGLAGWQLLVEGDTLRISSVPARVENIQQESQPWGSRIVIDLDRPTPWQFSDQRTEGVITLEASADPSLIERFNTPPLEQMPESVSPSDSDNNEGSRLGGSAGGQPRPTDEAKGDRAVIRVENGQNQTTLRVEIPTGKRLQVFSVPNPNRLVIDLRSDPMVPKEILWAPGIWWRQQYVNLGNSRFPVVWLEIDPRSSGISLRPIWSNPTTQIGTAPLIQTAKLWQAAAAINAGFFNRNNQLPLGAIRREGRWFSGPILNRGAIAWNDRGQFQFGRLSLQETLIASTGDRLPILFLNSGYVQSGIARYTPEWGSTYTPLVDNEVLVVVQNGQVTGQMPGGIAGQMSFPIPTDGYLLTLRSNSTVASSLGVGTQVRIESVTTPADFGSYPHILGAGPLLLQNQQIVLDAKAEQFSDAFIQQSAIRSAIGTTASGSLIIAAVHNRSGGLGPNLTETAQLMQQLGAINALNFDGGSSTGLYLGGQLLDRSPFTAARVHNGLGIFRQSLP
jgi:hypothetical protein